MTTLYNATLYRIPDVARACGVSISTVRNHYRDNRITPVYYMAANGAPLFTAQQVETYKQTNAFASRPSGRPPRGGRVDACYGQPRSFYEARVRIAEVGGESD